MPDLIKISLTFLLILLLLRRKLNIGFVMMISSVALSLLYRMGPTHTFETAVRAAANETTIKLLLALSLIRIFELILREKDILSAMTSAVRGFFSSRRIVIVSMPMLIGLLPSLGGAYFSAPMVKEATSGLGMSPEERAFINYWFRHPWEFILPLYPGILLASAVSGIPLYNFIASNLTYALVLLATGFIYSMREVRTRPASSPLPSVNSAETETRRKRGWMSFLPFLAVLLLVVGGRMELHYALLLMTTVLFLVYRYRLRDIPRIVRYGFARDVIVLIFGVMLFKEMMGASGAVENLSKFFLEQGIPSLPIICLLPFLTGLLTGITVAFVGSTFPLVMSITGGASLASLSLAFAAGFLGVLLSPVHLCLILTKEYFRADLWGVYRKIMPAGAFILVAAFVEYMLLR
jgi:integral membrane protein (TIGR00529 family)